MLSIGSGLTFLGSLAQGFGARRTSRKQAASERSAATDEMVRGRFQERAGRKEQESMLSAIQANTAASGLALSQGSPLEVYLQTARETELDILIAKRDAERRTRARLEQAKDLDQAGDAALFGSFLSGAGGLFKAGAKK